MPRNKKEQRVAQEIIRTTSDMRQVEDADVGINLLVT
jgi:hypothetical protein